MLLQNTLDLSTFEIVRFRIWNQTSNPNDYGIGTKYFNTNSGHEGYNRENIYTETGWRRTAYMDDIEALTNGEGSLGTRVKALEDMLKVDDANDVINTWAEIQAFLDQVQEGTDLMDLLNGKLDKTGGTITIDTINDLEVKRNGQLSAILFSNSNGKLGFLGIDGSRNPVFASSVDGIGHTLIHKGNYSDLIGDYYLKTTGGTISSSSLPLIINRTGVPQGASSIVFALNGTNVGILGFNQDGIGVIRPQHGTNSNYYNLLHSGNVGEYALKTDGSNAMTAGLQMGEQSIVWTRGNARQYLNPFSGDDSNLLGYYDGSAWKTIAFTDSTVAAAKKLTTDSHVYASFSDTGKYLLFGATAAEQGYNTYVDGYNIYFRYGGGYTSAMTITDKGRVVVGTDRSVDGDKLYSRGRVNILSLCDNPTLGNMPENGLVMTDNQSTLGLAQWVSNGTGAGNIQVGRFDGTATAYALNLNPLGGAVNVGEGGLNVKGNIVGQLLRLGNETSAGTIFFDRPSVNYIWASKAGGSVHMGVQDTGGTSSANATLSIYKDHIRSGDRNNAVSLGTSSFRWSNVYSVGGDFSGNIKVANDFGLLSTSTSGGVVQLIGMSKTNRFDIGTDACHVENLPATIHGSNIRFYTGASLDAKVNPMTLTTEGRVLIGGATDDENYALNVKGGVRFYDSSVIDYLIKGGDTIVKLQDTYAGSFRFVYGLQIGQEQKAAFGFAGTVSNPFAFIGQNSTRWFTINSEESSFSVLTNFNAGALIPTGQSLTIGSVTIKEVATGEIEVNGNLHTTGTLASGGKGEVGENTTGNAMVYQYELESGQSSYDVQNVKNNTNVIVQVYEWNGNTSSWDMILTDVSVKASGITVTFGRATTVNHLVTVC